MYVHFYRRTRLILLSLLTLLYSLGLDVNFTTYRVFYLPARVRTQRLSPIALEIKDKFNIIACAPPFDVRVNLDGCVPNTIFFPPPARVESVHKTFFIGVFRCLNYRAYVFCIMYGVLLLRDGLPRPRAAHLYV